MTKLLVLYYSRTGHIQRMAAAIAQGAQSVKDMDVAIKRVPDLDGFSIDKSKQPAIFDTPIATIPELPDYDALILGSPTYFGNMATPMKHFIDQMAGLWMENALVGKVGSVFTATGSQHGGHESAILSMHIPLFHLGFMIVGLPYSFSTQTRMDQIVGGSPYGAGTVSGGDGSRLPSESDLAGAHFQGAHVAQIAARLNKAQFL